MLLAEAFFTLALVCIGVILAVIARVTAGAPVLWSENRFVRPDLDAYWVSPQVGIGRFYAAADDLFAAFEHKRMSGFRIYPGA